MPKHGLTEALKPLQEMLGPMKGNLRPLLIALFVVATLFIGKQIFFQLEPEEEAIVLRLGKPLPETYVKVYAKLGNGQARFYKDGYTDLRGRFDYASLNTGDLDNARDFSILVLHDRHGAAIREAKPPTQ